jgi:hypothetical protein
MNIFIQCNLHDKIIIIFFIFENYMIELYDNLYLLQFTK